MPSTNGHGPKRAILYARVSTDEQGKSGYSIPDQLRELRDYSAREGYRVMEAAVDDGYSGGDPHRPGLRRVMELAEAGTIDIVLATKRDRFFRSRLYRLLWDKDLEELGVELAALNDTGNRFGDAMQDEFAEWEKEEITRRTMAGKLQKAREGKIVSPKRARYGFKASADGAGYEVDEEKMEIVRRIFHMVGVEKAGIRTVIKVFKREGVPSPTGKRIWVQDTVRRLLLEDSYKPHTFEELKEILSESVLATVDPAKAYGVYYFNREKITRRQVVEESPEGRNYRKRSERTIKDRSEWIGIPVPDSGILREIVDAARRELDGNERCSKADHKVWELSGGIMRCGYCGRTMAAQVTSYKRKDGQKARYHYYRCQKAATHKELCPYRKNYNANKLEDRVWVLVSEFLKNPERLRAGLEEKIRREEKAASLNRDSGKRVRLLHERISETQEKRRRYQEMTAEGLIDFEELRERLSELDEEKRLYEDEIESLKRHSERLEEMRRDKDALLAKLMELTPKLMEKLSPAERRWIYRRLGLTVTTRHDGTLDVAGDLTDLFFSNVEPTSRCRGRP